MVIVGDVNEMFMPLLDGFLADPVESEAVIDLLMEEIPKQFADTRETETILLPAIQAGMEALKVWDNLILNFIDCFFLGCGVCWEVVGVS